MAATPDQRRKDYLKKKKSGRCPRCGKDKKKNSKFIFCDDCRLFFRGYFNGIAEEVNEARKERYDRRKKNNECPRCGTPLGKKYEKTICEKCLNKQYKYNYGVKRKAKPKTMPKAKPVKSIKKKAVVKKVVTGKKRAVGRPKAKTTRKK